MDWNDPVACCRYAESVDTETYNRAAKAAADASVIETVNGHGIRPVSTQFGKLFSIGTTGRAFKTLQEARRHARTLRPN